ncbi:SDR family NAD(P)-dependent oxidoreductase [Pseudonocardia parietis]|uniref:NAD(P)-dependent dehydrogenase (Short-subunit alcohol dehydrogenase family) n=1 Tax=Pseudonocardia parietis TaxID=570936 RepID=A0ABS4VY28_9PSEU|nr:SDR family NAD(P)-dependent oxidoreductase [Pseudonocardia parietis]MBP2368805.1 NAD(P)-dependent dehydrogenase (short-subunit alcohol dehydrogenase family) [Pseudonocardia parietis]
MTDYQSATRNGPPNARPVAMVTGASRGLGFLLAREFADRGYDLVVCARDGLDPARADLARHGTQVLALEADVSEPADAARLVAETERRFGRLDVLATNAGVIQVGPAAEMRIADHEHAMDVMFWGVVHTVHAALPLLRRHHGRLLAVTSIGGKLPAPHLLPYSAAKHAAVGYAEGLRVEAARLGIGVTVAVPGLMRTGSTRNALFAGDDPAAERRWFTLAASTPVLSMDAERAARRLVTATLRGRAEMILTPAAKLGVRVHALAPGLTMRTAAAVERLLPGPLTLNGGGARPEPGHSTGRQPGWFARLTRLDRDAAHRWHELDDPA